MSDDTPQPRQLQIAAVTRADYKSGEAFADWQSSTRFAQLGGEFGELLMSSPVREQHADDPLILAAMLGKEPIGYINTFNGKLHADANSIDILWCSGLSVLPEHRSTGAGLMILLRLRSHALPSGAVGVSQVALPIYKQLGWHDITADRHLLIMRSAPILQRWINNRAALKLASTLVNAGLWLHRSALRVILRLRYKKLQVEEVSALPAEIDSQVRGLNRPLKTHRSVDWVNWAMRTGPQRNGRRLYLVRSRDGRPAGYFMTGVLHHEEADGGRIRDIRLASVRDWMSLDEQVLSDTDVLLLGLRTLLSADADAVELCVPESATGKALRKLGLLRKGALHMVMRFPPGTPGVPDAELDGDNFWFRPADGDGFVN